MAVNGRAGLAIEQHVAGFRPVAEQVVIAVVVVRDVAARVGRFVAGIDGAVHFVIAVNGRAGLAMTVVVADFGPVAVESVGALAVRQAVTGRTGPAAVDPLFVLVEDAVVAGFHRSTRRAIHHKHVCPRRSAMARDADVVDGPGRDGNLQR